MLKRRTVCIVLTLFAAVWSVRSAESQGRRFVLLLHSHHQTGSTDQLRDGVRSVLGKHPDLVLRIEYLDTQHVASEAYFESLAALYRQKYAETPPALILTSGEPARIFALGHQEDLFKQAPIVFCGVSSDVPGGLEGGRHVTGLVDSPGVADTLALGLRFRPDAERVYVLYDGSKESRFSKDLFNSTLKAQASAKLQAVFLNVTSLAEMKQELSMAGPGDLAIFLADCHDREGALPALAELEAVFRQSAVPVFGRSEWMIGRGQAGGNCVSCFRRGQALAELGTRILNGEVSADTPVTVDRSNQYIFDYAEIVRHKIKRSALPENHRLINLPLSSYDVSKPLLFTLIAFLLVLVTGILILTAYTRYRQRTAQALAASEQRYRTLVDNIGLGITLMDPTYRIIMVNAALQDMLGQPAAAFIGKRCFEIFGSRDTVCSTCPGKHAMASGEVQQEESHAVRADGSRFPITIRAFPLRDAQDNVSGFIEVVEDISARQQAVSQRDMLFNLSVDLLCIAGLDGYFKQLNPAWTRTFGWSVAELSQRPWLDFIDPRDRMETQRVFKDLQAGHPVNNYQNRFEHQDGSRRWISWNAFPLLDEQVVFAVARDVTAEHQAAQALRESEERFRNLVESSPMGVYMYELHENDDLILIGANPAADQITGIQTQRLLGKTIGGAFPNLADTEVPERYRRIARLGTSWRTEDLIYEDDQIHGAFDLVAFQTSKNRMAVMFMDITERKQTEASLRFTKFAVDHSAEAAFWMREDGRLIYVNEAVCRFLGYTPADLLKLNIYDINPDLPKKLWRAHWQELKSSGSFTMESQLRPRDGRVFPVEITFNHVEFEGYEYNCAFARDISERREAEEQVLKFKTITDRANYGAVIANMDRTLIYVNQAFAELHQSTPAEMIGTDILACHSEEDAEVVKQLLDQIQTQGGFVGEEIWHQRKDGSRFLTMMSTTLVQDELGNPHYLAATAIDITERREIEEQLRQSQKMESIGQLAGGVAHDFNNMLGGIVGFAELLRNDLEGNGEQLEFVQQILDSAERAADLTRKLLAFSRKGRVLSNPVDIHSISRAAVSILERSIDRRIQIQTQFNAAEYTVLGDSAQLQNAILNLCINSRDAMPKGGSLIVKTENRTISQDETISFPLPIEPGNYIVITVLDTGIGMTPETVEHIFEPFFTTKGVGKGTGLGLAAVYGTMNEHHGSIEVLSKPGEGSAFHLLLPLAATGVTTTAAPRRLANEELRGTGTILLVDDEPVVRAMGEALLRQLGYKVIIALDGEDGLQCFTEHRNEIDLVILDILMPRMNGQDCFRAIREIEPQAKVLISSGFAHDASIAQLEVEGLCGFVMKPYHRETMGKAVKDALSTRPQ